MRNIKVSIKGKIATIEVDLSVEGTDSKSGKSSVIATTSGNVDLPGAPGVKIGLTIYKKKGED